MITLKEIKLTRSIGDKIRAQRQHLKLSMQALATKTASSLCTIWELENHAQRETSAQKIFKIAQVLGVTVEYLLDNHQLTPTASVSDAAFFRQIRQLDPIKRAQLEKFLKAINED